MTQGFDRESGWSASAAAPPTAVHSRRPSQPHRLHLTHQSPAGFFRLHQLQAGFFRPPPITDWLLQFTANHRLAFSVFHQSQAGFFRSLPPIASSSASPNDLRDSFFTIQSPAYYYCTPTNHVRAYLYSHQSREAFFVLLRQITC